MTDIFDEMNKKFEEDGMSIDDFREMFAISAKPDDPNSKSPCSNCLGYDCGCVIASERTPSEECKCFHSKDKPIVVEFKDGTKQDANPIINPLTSL